MEEVVLMKDISKSELEIMKFLWENGESTSIEIVENVSKKNEWKSNTIMTLVSRLVSKGIVEAKKSKGTLIKIQTNNYRIRLQNKRNNQFYR